MSSWVLRDVRIVPVTAPAPPEPVDVLVRDGLVHDVAPRVGGIGPVEEIEGEGRWLIPGLWDQHVHLGQWVETADRLDLSDVESVEDVKQRVLAETRRRPGRPIVGMGHRPTTWDAQPNVADLDMVAGDVPVVLIAGDCHHGWLNTLALRALDLPLRSGVVAENEWFAAYENLAAVTGDETEPGGVRYRRAMAAAAAQGVVGITDFEFADTMEAWAERRAGGADLLRVRMATYAETLEDVIAAGLRTGDQLPGCDALATMGPLKIISDGSLNTRTAWCCDPYADPEPGSFAYGAPNLSTAHLEGLLFRASRHGIDVAVHAIGDAAADAALTAIAATRARGTIEHAQLMRREDLGRLAALGVTASVQPAHLLDDRDVTEHLWPGRGDRCFMLRSMLDLGVRLSMGSDAPVAKLDPWLAMAAAVHRSADDRQPWHPEQSLTPTEALRASVDGQPTVTVGSRADLALLDADPTWTGDDTAATAKHLRSMQVSGTWVAGARTHGS